MKKIFFLILISLLFCGSAFATTASITEISSGVISASQIIYVGPVRLMDLAIYTDGTHNVTVTCYDNASTSSGNVIAQASATGFGLVGDDFAAVAPRQASAGIYCTLSGTGGTYIVYYDNTYQP